jgi:hypothetical protein
MSTIDQLGITELASLVSVETCEARMFAVLGPSSIESPFYADIMDQETENDGNSINVC